MGELIMRHLLAFVLMIALVGSAAAVDLGSVQKDIKTDSHVGMNPGTPDGREGGEDMATAVVIGSLPFNDDGNTFDNVNDYDAVCPYSGSTSPDVVYSFTPAYDVIVAVDLCGSGYDTKTYIMDGAMNLIDCNDDAYFDDVCGTYVSLIEGAALMAGTEYFIVIDGYGTDAGDYLVAVTEFIPEPPCVLECAGLAEGEPALGPAYEDAFNGGCNSPEFGAPWGDLTAAGDANGELVFCGISGWTDTGRDTDWNYLVLGECGIVEVTVDAEQLTAVYTLTMTSCDDVAVDQSMTVGICTPGTFVVQGNPGDVIMLWFGAAEFTPPAGFVGYEYNYVATITGLDANGSVATEEVSFDGIKSLYR